MEEELYNEIGSSMPGAEKSQMFGKPCYKINGKAFISLFDNEMVFKLNGDFLKQALSLAGARSFDPSKKNRPMKEWVQIPYNQKKYWKQFAFASLDYVKDLTSK